MEKNFADIFSREPDRIIDGSYCFNVSWWDEYYINASLNQTRSSDEIHRKRNNYLSSLSFHWFNRQLDNECNDNFTEIDFISFCRGKYQYPEFDSIIRKIASESKPVLDIASCTGMGLIPFIAKLNPLVPCLVSDIDINIIECIRSYIDNNLPEFNISTASFDNFDIPFQDSSIDYVTSVEGLSSSFIISDKDKKYTDELFNQSEKVLHEIYRILKPGGFFVTFELNFEYFLDLIQIHQCCSENGKIFGIFSYEELKCVSQFLPKESWTEKFLSAGFELVTERENSMTISPDFVMALLYRITKNHNIHNWENRNWREVLQISGVSELDIEKNGIVFKEKSSFYILRKPL